jgi:hypothetical protein
MVGRTGVVNGLTIGLWAGRGYRNIAPGKKLAR